MKTKQVTLELTSRGGKVGYSSPCCDADVSHGRIEEEDSYLCTACGAVGKWKHRIKKSLQNANRPVNT